jgi:cytochrome c oxidase subunit II
VMRRRAERRCTSAVTFPALMLLAAIWVGGPFGCAGSPSMFRPAGPAADEIARLGWLFTIVAAAVTVITTGVLFAALFRRRPDPVDGLEPGDSVQAPTRWIVVGGIVLPAIVLVVCFVFALLTQSAIARPPSPAVATLEVTAHRWWWGAKYMGMDPGEGVVTANELHIPVGQPVRLELISHDVVHSFWVPELAGKTDVIPGQENSMWLLAARPGTYRGECAEYCGIQHTKMDFVVVADAPADFAAWLSNQRSPANPPVDPAAAPGQAVFQHSTCAACHAIRGTQALGSEGPDLTHLATRRTIAAGTLLNSRGNLAGWVATAQSLKPGSEMPDIPLSGPDLQTLLAYLETLK